MRQTISGLVAAVAVMTASAVPAMACGGGLFTSCYQPQVYTAPVYVAPAPTYSTGCNTGCGGNWAYERLPDPVHQYYYVNQGPTYSGPGNYAPAPEYRESALPVYPRYRHGYGYRAHRWHSYRGYYHASRMGYHYGHRVLRRYY
jgi:hypothetical protein